MGLLAAIPLTFMADASAAAKSIQDYITPVLGVMTGIAALVCTAALIFSGYLYMTSSGDPGRLDHAKRIFRNALIGFLIVLAASVVTAILHHAYTTPAAGAGQTLPALTEIQPKEASGSWTDLLIKAITGLFASIVDAIASPVLDALGKLTSSTPLMSSQPAVFNLWLVILAISNGLFVLVLALLGFRVMSGELLGLGELEVRSLLPQIGLVFLLMSTSIFAIDAIIGLCNAIISAIYAGFPGTNVWHALVDTMARQSGLGLPSLILFVVFLVLAVMLLVYYIGRMIVLFLGAAMSPFVVLLWLLPGFRDFASNLIKTYLMVVFVLLVHVVILMLAASLFQGLVTASSTGIPNPFMSTVIGIATVLALLRTQGLLIQMSLVSSGARATRKLGTQFVNGMSYTASKTNEYAASRLVDARRTYLINKIGARV